MIANIHLECLLKVNQCMYRILMHPNRSGLIPGIIQRATGPVSYTVMLSNGSTVKRHVDNIKARHTKNTSEEETSTTLPSNQYQVKHPVTIPHLELFHQLLAQLMTLLNQSQLFSMRPSRMRQPPKRFDNYVAIVEEM